MTKYEFLFELQASGVLRTLVKNGFVSLHYLTWMEIYQYHLERADVKRTAEKLEKAHPDSESIKRGFRLAFLTA